MTSKSLKRMRFLMNARERIVGISFTDATIHCALRDSIDSDAPARFLSWPLPPNIIAHGVVLDPEGLARNIEQALDTFKVQISFANLSIPSDLIFSSMLRLPKSERASDREKALGFLLDVELPWKKDLAYTDHHVFEEKSEDRISIFSITRSIADPYILAAEHAGVEVLALEFDAVSMLRLSEKNPNNTLMVSATPTQVNVDIVKDGAIAFHYAIPVEKVPDITSLKSELNHIRDYFMAETGEFVGEEVVKMTLNETAKAFLGDRKSDINILPAAGAALRKPSPKGIHELSLLPLRSSELYVLHRIASGLQLLRQAAIATCIILIGAHILMVQVLNIVAKQSSERAMTAPRLFANAALVEKQMGILNQTLAVGDTIASISHRYGPMLEMIDGLQTDGISFNAITTGVANTPITIAGVAATRAQYNLFRMQISSNKAIDVLSFPLGNLETMNAIPFTLSIKMKLPT